MIARGILYSINEGLLSLWRNKLISLLSIVTITVSFAILGVFLMLAVNVGSLAESYGDTLMLHTFLKDDATPGQREELEAALDASNTVAEYIYLDKTGAKNKFKELFPEEKDLLRAMEDNSLPASYEVKLKNIDASELAISNLVETLSGFAGVESVVYDKQWVETLETTGQGVVFGGLIIGGMLLFASIITTSNVIKLNVLTRKDEIEIMRLVGADGIFIRGPFILGGIIQGILASILSLVVLYGLFQLGVSFIQDGGIEMLQGLNLKFLPWPMAGLFIIGGFLVGFFASLLSFGKMMKA